LRRLGLSDQAIKAFERAEHLAASDVDRQFLSQQIQALDAT
jgi:predicted RNA polymerase sigma factor